MVPKTPELLDIAKLGGKVDTYRLRVGDYRVVFIVDYTNKAINIDKVGTKSEIEKRY